MTGTTVWTYKPRGGEHITADTHFSGIGGGDTDIAAEVAYGIRRYGHAIVTASTGLTGPWNHRMIGCGVGHDDAEFAETGRSMAAYYENGEAFGGRWWEDTSRYSPRRHYDPEGGQK